ncbi:uncharacterized protein [Ptychodera flava]|uniref:uncharacterized protein n=1 Tax=Ptychodera flava TaxID=63121 RepID=UPI00396A1DA0
MAMVKDGTIKSGNIENVEFAYYYVSNTDTGSAVTMAQSVFGVVVSYWSQQGTVTASQVNFDGGFSHHNFWSCTMEKLYRGEDREIVTRKQKPVDLLNQLIKQFSPEDGLVFDLCSGIGSTTVAALQCGRSCIAIENNTYKYDNLVTRLLITFNTNDFNDSEDTAS